jgi:superoxide dismutase, Fe-Mn family
MHEVTRRVAIGTAAIGLVSTAAKAQTVGIATAPPAFAGTHVPRPLGFDTAKLDGISERLIRSHWENNYQASVKALNMIEGRLAVAMADKDFPAVVYGGLKREQLHRTGSVVLHELYFGGLGGNGKAAGDIKAALAASHGSFEAWDAEFRRTAMSIAGGSGWCVLAFNLHTKSLHTYWACDHMHQPATGVPLIVLDMYEHAFHIDYGAAAIKYVDAYMRNLNWEIIDRRYHAVRDINIA